MVRAARAAIRSRSPVEIELPLGVHYALHSHLQPDAQGGVAETLDASGGAELLAQIGGLTGLEEISQLAPTVRRAHYGVRLTSPEPRLRLLPPARATRAA